MQILDVGHQYKLLSLDGKLDQVLQFVKRYDSKNPNNYPGNKNAYPGTTIQDVIHCLLNRVRYLNNQIPCIENEVIERNLQICILMLEQRAARRHGVELKVSTLQDLEMLRLCPDCGHTFCNCILEF